MEAITSTENKDALKTVQPADNTPNSNKGDTNSNDSGKVEGADFMSFMRTALGASAGGQVNEEELFAAIIGQRLEKTNPEAADFYKQKKDSLMATMARADGYVPVEKVANTALKATVDEGKIDAETASKVKSEAFTAAQLDDNLTSLWDSRGSEGDQTIAVSDFESSLARSNETLQKIESGELSVEGMSLDSLETGKSAAGSADGSSVSGSQELDGKGGFLWKPVSESDGNLVVLLPTDLKGLVDKVEIHSELPPGDATKLAEGRFAGDDENGNRPHFRFDEPGEAYGENVYVVAYKSDGDFVSYNIPNGSERND